MRTSRTAAAAILAAALAGCTVGPRSVPGAAAPLTTSPATPTTATPAGSPTPATPTGTPSRPPARETPSGTAVLPAAYAPDTFERLGVTVEAPVPRDWSRDVMPDGLWYGDPSGRLLLRLEVQKLTGAAGAARAWEINEPRQLPRLPGYRRLGIDPVPGRDGSVADWRFTFRGAFAPRQVIARGIVWRGTTVSVYFSAEQRLYDQTLPVFTRVTEGLRITGG